MQITSSVRRSTLPVITAASLPKGKATYAQFCAIFPNINLG